MNLYEFWNTIFFILFDANGNSIEFEESLIVYLNSIFAEYAQPIEQGCTCGQWDCLECMPF